MKKTFVAIILMVVLLASVVAFVACTPNKKWANYFDEVYAKYTNLADGASFYNFKHEKQGKFSLKGKSASKRNLATVDLGEVKKFNTITLQESNKKQGVILFSIYASNEMHGDYDFIYQGDTIETGRVCFVENQEYRYLRIFISDIEGDYDINDIGVYNILHQNTDKLRSTAYLVMDDVDENYDLSTLEGFTDIILFSSASFDTEGNIVYKTKDGFDNGETYQQKLNIIRNKIGDRDVNLIGDIYLPYDEKHASIYAIQTTYLDKTVQNIKQYVEKFNLDGYDIDYEYPINAKQWTAYNTFLKAVKKAMPDKILSIATSQFFLKFDKEAVESIDRVQYMLYDDFDKHGYQSTFPYMVNGVKKLIDLGFTPEKIEIGIPTYSRPIDGYAFWGNYADYAEKMGRYDNLVYVNVYDHGGSPDKNTPPQPLATPQYLNSYQMVLDKTAFALDAGLGGIMSFRVGCDLPYSEKYCLARAIVDAKALRKA